MLISSFPNLWKICKITISTSFLIMSQLENIDHSNHNDLCLDSMKKIRVFEEGKYGKTEVFQNITNSEKIAIKKLFFIKR